MPFAVSDRVGGRGPKRIVLWCQPEFVGSRSDFSQTFFGHFRKGLVVSFSFFSEP
jgi:hypothetical protein